jgi:hypothetical protein
MFPGVSPAVEGGGDAAASGAAGAPSFNAEQALHRSFLWYIRASRERLPPPTDASTHRAHDRPPFARIHPHPHKKPVAMFTTIVISGIGHAQAL